MTTTFRRSQGAVLFASIGKTQSELASRYGISAGFVSMLQNGQRKAGLELRKAMLDKDRIPIESWDQEPSPVTLTEGASSPSQPEWGVKSATTRLQRLEKQWAVIADAVEAGTLTAAERSKAFKDLTVAELTLRKITGESASDAQILRGDRWRKIERVMLEALKPYPDALQAVGNALRELDDVG